MPDTPGKRQRREVQAKRRRAKDEKRAARKARRRDSMAPTELGETTDDQQRSDTNDPPLVPDA